MRLIYRMSVLFFWVWLKLFHSLKVYNRHNLPKGGSFIVVANHVSFADPPLIGAVFMRTPLCFMAKKELFEDKKWGWWFRATSCIPILRNKNDFGATKEALNRLTKGMRIALFPEGTRSEDNEIKEPEMGVAFLASKANVPVLPVYIEGTFQTLPKGGKYKSWTPIKTYIGEMINFREESAIKDKRERYEKMSKHIMDVIKSLRDQAKIRIA